MARFKMAAWTFGVVGRWLRLLSAIEARSSSAFLADVRRHCGLLVLLARRADVVVESPKVDVRNPSRTNSVFIDIPAMCWMLRIIQHQARMGAIE